jgi:uncharacterized protein
MNQLKTLTSAASTFARKHPSLKLLVLFGSRARGDAGFSSDWDFAFLSNSSLETKDIQAQPFWFPGSDILETISGLISTDRIDLVDLERCSPLLGYVIAKEGHIVYEAESNLFLNFQLKAWKRYADTDWLRRYQKQYIEQGLERLTQ